MKCFKINQLLQENQSLFFTYSSNRYIKVQSEKYISNLIIKNSLEKIGSNKKYIDRVTGDVIEFKGSHLHIGLKKICYHSKKRHDVNLTVKEIKALMNTRKKIYKSQNVICCTYNVYIILKSITELLTETSLNKYYEYLPDFFHRIEDFHDLLKDFKNREDIFVEKIIKIREVIVQLNRNIN